MAILGSAIANYLSGLGGLYSVELPETLWHEMIELVVVGNSVQANRALLVTDDPITAGTAQTIPWREILGWRTTDDRIFAWKRGTKEPDTSFRGVVRPFISSRFPGANGGECTLELLVRLSITELWRRRGHPPVGDSFEAFLDTSNWVTGILHYIFEKAGSMPSIHWSDRFLEHWASMLTELDQRLTAWNAPADPRHAWEIVRVSGLPLPSAIVNGNPFLAKPSALLEKEWPRLADLWDEVVHSFIQVDGGIPILLTALDHQVIGATTVSPWRNLPWELVANLPADAPSPVVGARVFTAPQSPTLVSAAIPSYPIAPVPSWWGVSSDDLGQASDRLTAQTPLVPDVTSPGLLRLFPQDPSPYVLNTRTGTVAHAHTGAKWKARVTVDGIHLRFKEDWQHLHVAVLEPQSVADGDAWINPDLVEINPKGARVQSRHISGVADRLAIQLALLVEYVARRDAQGNLVGTWNANRSLRVKLSIQYRMGGQWALPRSEEAKIELIIPSPFNPTIIVSDLGRMNATSPDGQDEFTANLNSPGSWQPDTTPTILLKEEGRYDVQVYDGTLAPNLPQFSPLCQPAVGGVSFATASTAMFPATRYDLDDGVLVTNVAPATSEDLAAFKVKERSGNLSSGLLSAVRGRPAGRQQPSAAARGSVLGQYQSKVTEALCAAGRAQLNSLYQYVISASDVPVTWPAHSGGAAPTVLMDTPPGFVFPGVGNGPGVEILQSIEWQRFMDSTSAVCAALNLVPGSEDIWLSGVDLGLIPVDTVRSYVDCHRDLVHFAKQHRPAEVFWASFPFSVFVVEGRHGVSFGQLLAVLLSPLHPARLAWGFGVTQIAKNNTGDPALLGLIEGWNIPCTGTTVNTSGQKRPLVAVPTDPGPEQDFVAWSALAVLSDSGLATLPVFAAGQQLPWGGRTGINARVVERALKDYLVVHPHLNSFEIDIRSVSPSPRSQEIDEAVLRLVGTAGTEEIAQLGGGTRVWDSADRQGAVPTRDKLFSLRSDGERGRPFEWRTYESESPPSDVDMALIENASVHLAVVPGTTEGVLGLIALRRFSPGVLDNLTLNQNFSAMPGEDLLGLADLLREIESESSSAISALRATPQVQALGVGQGARWEVLGTFNLDPSLLSSLVASSTQGQEKRLLWEWRPSWMSVERKDGDLSRRPYYVIARIPASLLKALQSRQGITLGNAEELLRTLGHRGIGLAALNAHAGTQESAAAGFFYAMQLFLPPAGTGSAFTGSADNAILGVIPIDPIEAILQGLVGRKLKYRADFLAVVISRTNDGRLKLCFVPVEVKHHGMPSNPEPIPLATDRELQHARQQLAETAILINEIGQGLLNTPGAADAAATYLKRLGLATLLDLAMSFTPVAPEAAERSAILRDTLAGSFSIGVGDPILLWFAPGSGQSSGAPCVVDRYGPTTIGSTQIREVYLDPAMVPGLWWTGEPFGPNEVQVKSQVENVIEASFSGCAGNNAATSGDLREALQRLFGISSSQTNLSEAAGAPDSASPPGPTTNDTPATMTESTAVSSISEAPASSSQQQTEKPIPSSTPAPQVTVIPLPDAREAELSEASTEQPAIITPRAIIGWSEPTSRWAAVGKLAGSDEIVALDLDHPKTIGIFGYMGSGKSYLLGNLIEGAVESLPGINVLPSPLAVVVFNYRRNASDRFELSSLAVPNQNASDVQRLSDEYQARPAAVRDVHVLCLPGELRPERRHEYGLLEASELFFDPRTLGVEDWELLMGEPGSEAVFARTIRNTLVDLRSAGEISFESLEQQVTARLSGQSRAAARLRFDFVRRYISEDRGIDFRNLLRPGRILVVDLRQPLFNKEDALRFFLVCANYISKVQGEFNKMIIFDEAHEYMSEAFGERMEARIRLMRHEGTSYVFATQDVKSIPLGVSRFLSTRFVFDLGTRENLQDLEQVAPEFRGFHLTGIAPGSCFVQANTSLNAVFNRPREVKIRPRVTQHGGGSRIFST